MPRLPVIKDLHVDGFAGGVITSADTYGKNVIYDQYDNDEWYAKQRPGINIFEDASDEVAKVKGRGVYYWDAVSKKYLCNDDTVYQESYAGSTMSITTGVNRVYFFEVGNYLVVIDPENSEGWFISSSTPTVITELTNATHGFPTAALANGGAVLNGKLYLLTTAGDIYESDVEDPTTWGASNFRNAEMEPDDGVYLAKHHEHIVVFGTRTIEFFYDNANPTGSTLNVREDISYSIGAATGDHVFQDNDKLFFVSQARTGGITVKKMERFNVQDIGPDDFNSLVSSAILDDGMCARGSGFVVAGRLFYVLSICASSGGASNPQATYVYCDNKDWWAPWQMALAGYTGFPVVDWTVSTSTRNGEGILTNGDLVTMRDDGVPNDSEEDSAVFEADVFETGVYLNTTGIGQPIAVEIILGHSDYGSRRRKFMSEAWLVATQTEASQTVTLAWSDEDNSSYTNSAELNAGDVNSRINRMGSFRSRNIKLTHAATELIEIKAVDATVTQKRA